MKKVSILLVAALGLISAQAGAYDFSQADSLFARRGEGPATVHRAQKLYERALSRTRGRELVHASSQLARLSYFEGDLLTPQSNKRARKAIFSKCMDYINKIKPEIVGPTGAYYHWKTTCLALWAKAAGQLRALTKIGELKRTMEAGLSHRPSYDGGGIHRVAAAIYIRSKMMRLLGLYSPEKALRHINKAINYGPDYYNAYLIKAEVLKALDKDDDAIELLEDKIDELEGRISAGDLPADRKFESNVYLKRMKKLLRDF